MASGTGREANQQGHAVGEAIAAWAKAPTLDKSIAGKYVGPLLEALREHEKRIQDLEVKAQA